MSKKSKFKNYFFQVFSEQNSNILWDNYTNPLKIIFVALAYISYVKHLFQAPRAIGMNLKRKQWKIVSKMVKIIFENDMGAVLNLLGIYRKCIESKNCCIDTALFSMLILQVGVVLVGK